MLCLPHSLLSEILGPPPSLSPPTPLWPSLLNIFLWSGWEKGKLGAHRSHWPQQSTQVSLTPTKTSIKQWFISTQIESTWTRGHVFTLSFLFSSRAGEMSCGRKGIANRMKPWVLSELCKPQPGRLNEPWSVCLAAWFMAPGGKPPTL